MLSYHGKELQRFARMCMCVCVWGLSTCSWKHSTNGLEMLRLQWPVLSRGGE